MNTDAEWTTWYQACDPDHEANKAWIVDLDGLRDAAGGERRSPRGIDVVGGLHEALRRGRPNTAYLLAGFPGVGKTTALDSLEAVESKDGAVVLRGVAAKGVWTYAPDEAELALRLARALASAALETLGKGALPEKDVSGALELLLKKAAPTVSIGTMNVETMLDAGRDAVRHLFEPFGKEPVSVATRTLRLLAERVTNHCHNKGLGRVTFLVDNLEKIAPLPASADALYGGFASLFASAADLFRLPGISTVAVVSPYLTFVRPVAGAYAGVYTLPAIRVAGRPPRRTPDSAGCAAIAEVLGRRMPLERAFGARLDAAVRVIALACAGHLRDTLRLVQQVIIAHRGAPDSIPLRTVKAAAMAHAATKRGPFLTNDVVEIAKRVSDSGATRVNDEDLAALARACDGQFLLPYHNGEPWYDVHPCLRS